MSCYPGLLLNGQRRVAARRGQERGISRIAIDKKLKSTDMSLCMECGGLIEQNVSEVLLRA